MSTNFFKCVVFFLFASNLAIAFERGLAICAIFKNDVEYIPEWIDFHLKQGVEYFYLYDNHLEPVDLSLLKKYIKMGAIEIIPWRHSHGNDQRVWCNIQCSSYMDCIEKNKDKWKWIAFIDTDEFLFSPEKKDLRVILKEYDKFAGVCVNWVMYGTSNVQEIPKDKKMLDLLVMREPLVNLHIKSIVQPKFVSSCHNMHFFVMVDGVCCVTENKEFIDGPFSKFNSVNKLRINHYWSRDKRFFENVKIPRVVGVDKKNLIDIESSLNVEYDPILSNTRP